MNARTILFLSAALALSTGTVVAQAGSLDMTFNPGDAGFGYGDGANGHVQAVGLQEDGKILIAGYFTAYNGTGRNRIARLNADGSLDMSFDPGSGANGSLFALAMQPDGKILIGGEFTTYAGTTRNRIARLNTDGSLDNSFDPGLGVEYVDSDYQTRINTIVWQPAGKILIGGAFTTYNGIARNRIAQLNTDGSLATSFDPGAGPDGNGIYTAINSIAVQPNDKILVAGYFTIYHGTAHNRIARLNADGSLDTSFDPGTGAEYNEASTSIEAIALQPDNRILIGGGFITYNGTARNHIARLNADGSLDTTFDPGTGADGTVLCVAVQSDGRIRVAGSFYSFNGTERNRIARLNTDGSLDTGFDPGAGANGTIYTTTLQPDGKIMASGWFTTYSGTDSKHVARLNADGSLDTSFSPGGTGSNEAIAAIALQPDGRILLAGSFGAYDGTARNRVARLNTDGGLDMSFDPGTWMTGSLHSLALQPDGRILIGGAFNNVQGSPPNNLARLNADGSLDSDWIGWAFTNVYSVVLQPDGEILVGGGTSSAFLARLNTDGGSGTTFNTGSLLVGLDRSVFEVALQSDGKILVGGHFHQWDTVPFAYPHHFARLNTDGSVDTNFFFTGTPYGPITDEGWVHAITVQPDSTILIGGDFTNYNTVPRNRIARLLADGSLDTTFDPGAGADGTVSIIVTQPDGKILIGGAFTSYNGTDRNHIARLNSDGSLDMTFNPGNGANGAVSSIALQPDGRVLIGGDFTGYDGIGRNRIARLMGDDVFDCEGLLGGPALPGTACDDGCALNGTEVWDPSCMCAGQPLPDLVELTPFDTLCPVGDPYPLAHAVPAGGTWSITGNSLDAELNNNLFQAGYGLPNGGGVSVTLTYIVADPNTGCTLSATQSIRWMTPLISPVGPGDCEYTPLQLMASPVGIPGTWDYPADANGVLDRSCEARPFTIRDSVYTMHAVNGDCRFRAPSISQGEQFQLYYKPCTPPVTISPSPDTLSNCWDPAGFIEWNGDYLTSPPNWQLWNFTGCDNSENATIQCLFYPAQHEPGQYTIVEHYTSTYYCGTSTDTLVITVTGPPVWHADADGDGLGAANDSLTACEQPAGYVDTASDCDDADANVTAPGDPCDDGNANTANDVLTEGCVCLGTPVDTDGDGVPDDTDCAPEDPTIQVLNAGTNGTCSVCDNNTAYDLFNCLGSGPQSGGTWKRLPAGTVVSAFFDASAEGSGTYQFRYVLNATANCPGDSAVATVVVTAAPDAGLSSAPILCANADPVGLMDLLGGSPDPTGLWTAPNGALHTGFFVPGTDPPGAYGYQVEGQGPCAGDSAIVLIDLQVPLLIVPLSIPTSVLDGEVAVFSVEPSGAEWTWTPPVGWTYDETTGSEFEATVVGVQGTVDSVCVQGVLAACVADSCFDVTIDGSVGIADTQSIGPIFVYPNPGNELFTVASFVADGPYRYEVLDALGRKLLDSGTQLTPFTLDLSFLATGTYMLRWHGDGRQGSVPVVKQ